jgi:glycerol-3-phosphate acyltransferase PlsY
MDTIPILTSIIVGYFMGNIMASYLVTKWVLGIDIREHGTGNAGGSNSFMIMGWKNGLIVGIVDILKAFLAVYIIKIMYPSHPNIELLLLLAGVMAVVGHIFPFFMGFRGGKGMACFMGMCFAINPMIGLYVILATIAITVITDYVALASMSAYIFLPIILAFAPDVFFKTNQSYDLYMVSIALALGFLGIWKHRDNISNMLKGQEKGLRQALKKHS